MHVNAHASFSFFFRPLSVVEYFLEEVAAHGSFRGVPARGFLWQRLENDALRDSLCLGPDDGGVLIVKARSFSLISISVTTLFHTQPNFGQIDPLSAAFASGALRPGDVLLSAGGCAVGGDGTVSFRGSERLDFSLAFRDRHVGDALALTLRRRRRHGGGGGGSIDQAAPSQAPQSQPQQAPPPPPPPPPFQDVEVSITLTSSTPLVPAMPCTGWDSSATGVAFPSYLVVGGLVRLG